MAALEEGELAGLEPRNLARAAPGRESWADEFALAECCEDPASALACPHTWQRVELPPGAFPELDRLPLQRTLLEASPRRPYRRREQEVKSTVHWGQRKLLMSELELLTEHGSEAKLIVYAGAAPGGHLACLCGLFPELAFEAFDPRRFHGRLLQPGGPPNLQLHQEVFTDELARQLASRGLPMLFVSDIRTADWQKQEPEDHDACLLSDLQAQRRWVEIMRPRRSLLKFRLPYTDGVTEYLEGELRLPVWGPQTTTECRLLVTCEADGTLATRPYNHCKLSEQLFHFNTVARISVYPPPRELSGGDPIEDSASLLQAGLCRCFDCSRELEILRAFLTSRRHKVPTLVALVALSHEVSRACGRGPDGLLAAPPAPWEVETLRAAKMRRTH